MTTSPIGKPMAAVAVRNRIADIRLAMAIRSRKTVFYKGSRRLKPSEQQHRILPLKHIFRQIQTNRAERAHPLHNSQAVFNDKRFTHLRYAKMTITRMQWYH
jgi:hypothetical protein